MKKLAVIFTIVGSVLFFQSIVMGSATAASTMSPTKVIFPKLNALLVHCCHAHPVHPYDNYCCHSGAYVAPAVGAAVAYGSVRRTSRRTARRVSRRR